MANNNNRPQTQGPFSRFTSAPLPNPPQSYANQTSNATTANRPRGTSFAQRKADQDEAKFQQLYTACSGMTPYHDLSCGHRVVSTSQSDKCGGTCKVPGPCAPFICPDCVVDGVRIEMVLEGISLTSSSDTDMSREEKIRAIADEEVKKLRKMRYRMGKVTKKFEDPRLQFFHEFMVEDGFGGIDDGEVDMELSRTRKRPGVWKGRGGGGVEKGDDGGAVRRAKKEVGEEEEDDAMKAVRQALEACAIDGGV